MALVPVVVVVASASTFLVGVCVFLLKLRLRGEPLRSFIRKTDSYYERKYPKPDFTKLDLPPVIVESPRVSETPRPSSKKRDSQTSPQLSDPTDSPSNTGSRRKHRKPESSTKNKKLRVTARKVSRTSKRRDEKEDQSAGLEFLRVSREASTKRIPRSPKRSPQSKLRKSFQDDAATISDLEGESQEKYAITRESKPKKKSTQTFPQPKVSRASRTRQRGENNEKLKKKRKKKSSAAVNTISEMI